jgi:energy-coupling factor transporter ATP-binding protein EcfA2
MNTSPPLQPIAPPVGGKAEPPAGAVPVAVPDLIDLPTGKELDQAGATKLEAARPVRLVVVAGPVGCGKTTLLKSLYELFQWAPVSGYSFAGSNTLPAFERRCYLSRTASERSAVDTERTPYGEVRYLHLRLAHEDLSHGELDFLFTDVSGESFERARDSTQECQRLTFLRQADHFLLLLDSEKLVRKEKRWEVAHDSMTLLRSCLDSGMLPGNCLVNILWTKFDYFEAAGAGEHAQFLSGLKGEIETEFGSRVGRLSFSEIAARPTQVNNLKFGHGLPELLKYWATSSPRERSMNLLPAKTLGTRESELFASRHFAIADKSS